LQPKLNSEIYKQIGKYGVEKIYSIYAESKSNFEDIIQADINDEEFTALLLNAQFSPQFNTKTTDFNLKDLFFRSNFRLPKAASYLYSANLSSLSDSHGDIDEYEDKGWMIKRRYYKKDFVESVKQQLCDFNYSVPRLNNGVKYHRNDILNKTVSELESSTFSSNLTDVLIKKNSPIGKIIYDENLINTVSKLCGNQVFLVGAASLYAKDKPEDILPEEWKNTAHAWHFDYSHLKFVKVFIFLSDVLDEGYGPHSFIESSHEENLLYPQNVQDFLIYKTYARGYIEGRVKDEWVNDHYDKNKIKTFLGSAGDILFENTTGLHKAGYCRAGDREILQLLFAISNFGDLKPDRQFQVESDEIDTHFYLEPVNNKSRKKQMKIVESFSTKNGPLLYAKKTIKSLLHK